MQQTSNVYISLCVHTDCGLSYVVGINEADVCAKGLRRELCALGDIHATEKGANDDCRGDAGDEAVGKGPRAVATERVGVKRHARI